MKKWFPISLAITAGVSTIAIVSALSIRHYKVEKAKKNEVPIAKKEYLENNKFINKMLLDIFKDKELTEKYVNFENSISNQQFDELKYSLNFFPIFRNNVSNFDNAKIIASLKKNIVNTLTENWFWYLNNISKFIFVFNPYGDDYKLLDKEEELLEKVKSIFPDISLKLTNNKIIDFYESDYKTMPEVKKYNEWTDIKNIYYFYKHNIVIKGFTYQYKNKINVIIRPSLLYFNNSKSIEETKKQIDKLDNLIFEKRSQYIKNEYKYEEQTFSNFNASEFYKKNNDTQMLTLFNDNGYNRSYYEASAELSSNEKNKIEIFRFSWRDIDD